MSGMLARSVTTSASIAVFFSVVWMASSDVAQDRPAGIIAASKAELLAMTPLWKGERYADVRPEVRARLELLGRERALIYKTLVLTGLRKGELASLTVASLDLDAETGEADGEPGLQNEAVERDETEAVIAARGEPALAPQLDQHALAIGSVLR